jgi:hypothetical protein
MFTYLLFQELQPLAEGIVDLDLSTHGATHDTTSLIIVQSALELDFDRTTRHFLVFLRSVLGCFLNDFGVLGSVGEGHVLGQEFEQDLASVNLLQTKIEVREAGGK